MSAIPTAQAWLFRQRFAGKEQASKPDVSNSPSLKGHQCFVGVLRPVQGAASALLGLLPNGIVMAALRDLAKRNAIYGKALLFLMRVRVISPGCAWPGRTKPAFACVLWQIKLRPASRICYLASCHKTEVGQGLRPLTSFPRGRCPLSPAAQTYRTCMWRESSD